MPELLVANIILFEIKNEVKTIIFSTNISTFGSFISLDYTN
jgi:hypothetical protein